MKKAIISVSIRWSNGKNPVYLAPLGSATAKVIVKDCVFEDALGCEFYGQESQFTITGNTFNSTFDFADKVTALMHCLMIVRNFTTKYCQTTNSRVRIN